MVVNFFQHYGIVSKWHQRLIGMQIDIATINGSLDTINPYIDLL